MHAGLVSFIFGFFLITGYSTSIKVDLPLAASFKSHHGTYLYCDYECDGSQCGYYTGFTSDTANHNLAPSYGALRFVNDTYYHIPTGHGTYYSAQSDGSLACDRTWVRSWE